MPTMTLRVDDKTREELEAYAQTAEVTVSELVRRQIDVLLGRNVEIQREAPHTLSPQQRLVLAQQHEILALLNAEDEDAVEHYQNIVTVLREGYTGEYWNVFDGLRDELSRAECDLLWSILDMFSDLAMSLEALGDDERAALGGDAERRLLFSGFDLNDGLEARLLTYTRFLFRTGRWPDVKRQFDRLSDRGNSHHRNLPAYERMLAAQQRIVESRGERGRYSAAARLLSAEELQTVAAEWPHPPTSQ